MTSTLQKWPLLGCSGKGCGVQVFLPNSHLPLEWIRIWNSPMCVQAFNRLGSLDGKGQEPTLWKWLILLNELFLCSSYVQGQSAETPLRREMGSKHWFDCLLMHMLVGTDLAWNILSFWCSSCSLEQGERDPYFWAGLSIGRLLIYSVNNHIWRMTEFDKVSVFNKLL